MSTLSERLHGGSRATMAAFAFVAGTVAVGSLAVLAHATGRYFVFPSLGPTACLLFWFPLVPAAGPRNVILGHSIGVAAGWGCLAGFGLLDAPAAFAEGVTLARCGAAALSVGVTNGLMTALRVPHPPAAATTLIVSLGVIRKPADVGVLLAAVVLLALEAWVIHAAFGLRAQPRK